MVASSFILDNNLVDWVNQGLCVQSRLNGAIRLSGMSFAYKCILVS